MFLFHRSWLYTSCFPSTLCYTSVKASTASQFCLSQAGCLWGRFPLQQLPPCSQERVTVSTASPNTKASLPLLQPGALALDTGAGGSCATEHIIFVTEYLQMLSPTRNTFQGSCIHCGVLQRLPTAKTVIDIVTARRYTQQGE